MAASQTAAEATGRGLRALAESGSLEAVTRIRNHISVPALAQFSVSLPTFDLDQGSFVG